LKRGRRSSADWQPMVLRPPGRPLLEPPPDLTDGAALLFREIVKACPIDHFVEADRVLLVIYVEAICALRDAATKMRNGDKAAFTVWERSSRVVAQFAAKLRLCPSSRIDARAAARRLQGHPIGPEPWED
jgi:hypothetical protein